MKSTSRPFAAAAAALVTMCFASVLAGRADGGGQAPPARPGPAPAKGACRTYDTSVTSVTSGGPMQATIEWTGVFDPWSLRFVQNINFSSNQGSHFSYVQVSTWASLEDFITEADIVPPLMRSRSTTGNGAIGLTKTNAYDSTGRLTGFVTRTAGGTITTRYTAWDAVGRPTAGTMQSSGSTSTVTLSYDDKARTETQTTTTRGITSVISNTYDQFGNMRGSTSSVTRGQGSTTTYTPHASVKVCLSDTKAPAVPALKPAGPNPSGTFSGTIGGRTWTAAVGLQANTTGSIVSVGGSDSRYIVSIGLSTQNGPGQYKAGSLGDEDFTKLASDQFKALINRNTVVATVFDSQTKQSWQASPTIGSGTVNLAAASGAAAGTFSLTLDPVPGTGASGSINFSGSFNIRY